MSNELIYLDHNASTPIAAEVREVMLPLLTESFGNPSCTHWAGRPAAEKLARAREQVASLLQAHPDEIIFTSGGSESSNAAIKGVVMPFLRQGKPAHIISSAVDHAATRASCQYLVGHGATLTLLPVDAYGMVSIEQFREALRPETVLVSIMHANNEVGTLQPIAEMSAITRKHGALFHTDAAQSAGKIDVHANVLGAHLISLAGHKLYAPKGIGVLYIERGVQIDPFVHGAGHESGRRAGTENVLFAVGLGAACDLAWRSPYADEVCALRDSLWEQLHAALGDGVQLLGHPTLRLPNTANIAFVDHIAQDILAAMPNVAASAGAACHATHRELSTVLRAMGVAERVGLGAIRFSLGRSTTQAHIDTVVAQVKAALAA